MASRPYLRTADRRQQLLDAFGRVLASEGATGLNMKAIADEAGITRQLLYTHFPNLSTIVGAYAASVFVGMLDASGVGREVPGSKPDQEAIVMLNVALGLRPEQAQLMRLMHARAALDGLEELTTMYEGRLAARWRDYPPFAPLSDGALRTMLWTMTGAVFDIAEGVSRGDISNDDANRAAAALPAMLLAAFTPTMPARPTRQA